MKTTYRATDSEKAVFLVPPEKLSSIWVRYFDATPIDSWVREASSGTVVWGKEWAASYPGTEWTAAYSAPDMERVRHLRNWLAHVPATESPMESWFEPTVSAVDSPVVLGELRSGHRLRDEREVLSFLSEHVQLVPVLLDGRRQVSQLFGADSLVELEVVIDPESVGYRQLFAYIITSLNAADVIEQLRRFDDEWFLAQSSVVGDLLCYSPVIR